MTEPLKVDTDGLDAASAILKSAAGQIPTQLPQFSVNGSDPLSAVIAAGSAQMEAPMAALPGIKANATTTAENIGVAGQRYRETDETLAQRARQHLFDKDGAGTHGATGQPCGTHGGGIGKYKASPVFGKDLPTLPDDPSGQKSVADTLLSNMADGGKSAGAGSTGVPGSLMPDKTDWILGGAGAAGQTFTDKIAELTRRGLETGGDGASPTLKKAVEEIKNPFTFLGRELPALGSKPGGIVGAILSIPSVVKDVGEGNMSAGQAITRGVVGFGAGLAAAPFGAAVAGPPGAFFAAGFAGHWAANGVDAVWGPLSTAQEIFSEMGGPGEAMKAARWGR